MALIEVTAENAKLWINDHVRDDGSKWYTYSISTSSKDKDTGDYINKSLEVRMTRDVVLPEGLANGETVDIKGSLSNRAFTDKEGNKRVEHMLWAREVDFPNRKAPLPSETADSYEALEEDLPF